MEIYLDGKQISRKEFVKFVREHREDFVIAAAARIPDFGERLQELETQAVEKATAREAARLEAEQERQAIAAEKTRVAIPLSDTPEAGSRQEIPAENSAQETGTDGQEAPDSKDAPGAATPDGKDGQESGQQAPEGSVPAADGTRAADTQEQRPEALGTAQADTQAAAQEHEGQARIDPEAAALAELAAVKEAVFKSNYKENLECTVGTHNIRFFHDPMRNGDAMLMDGSKASEKAILAALKEEPGKLYEAYEEAHASKKDRGNSRWQDRTAQQGRQGQDSGRSGSGQNRQPVRGWNMDLNAQVEAARGECARQELDRVRDAMGKSNYKEDFECTVLSHNIRMVHDPAKGDSLFMDGSPADAEKIMAVIKQDPDRLGAAYDKHVAEQQAARNRQGGSGQKDTRQHGGFFKRQGHDRSTNPAIE